MAERKLIIRIKYLLLSVLVIFSLSLALGGCTSTAADQPLTFSQLISQADKYNGQTVTFEAFYFSGFEISALSESVGPAAYDPERIVPTGALIWAKGGITQEIADKLYTQTITPSGYPEHIGKLKVTGRFETGSKYGHMDAYQYQITMTKAEMLEWSPPPNAAS